MSDRTRRVAWGIWASSFLLSVSAVGLTAATGEPLGGTLRVVLGMSIPFTTVGALIASRWPGNSIGWLFCAVGFLQSLNVAAGEYGTYALVTGARSLAAGPIMTWVADVTWFPSLALLGTFSLLLFPTGRPPARGWHWLGWAAAGGLLLAMIPWGGASWHDRGVPLLTGQADDPSAPVMAIIAIGISVVGLCAVASVVSLLVRFHRSRGTERQQLKWLVYAGAIAVAATGAAFLPSGVPLAIGETTLILALMTVPVAAGIAILRHRLFDIDVLVNRTLVYGALTTLVIGLYVATVGVVGWLFQRRVDLMVSLFATGLVAVLFQPARERLQRRVDSLMFGESRDYYGLISRIGRRLEERGDPVAVLSAVADTVAEALRLPGVVVELHRGSELVPVARSGHPQEDEHVVPLSYQGETVGRLRLGLRATDDAFSATEERIVVDLARQIGVVAYAVSVTHELRRSRERLVTAREEERRRIRRDLHDGLGPALAGVALGLEAARNLIDRDPVEAGTLIDRLLQKTQRAITDIRGLVYDLRPPSLDELGLVGALREQGSHFQTAAGRDGEALLVVVEGPERLPQLPAAVEVAVYRIALEALTNVCRHAEARTCLVRISCDGVLELEVVDDGRGIAPMTPPGVGMASMRERISELGGILSIERRPVGGTRVLARLPLETA